MTAPHVCVRCAGLGRTCCQLSGGDAEFCFPLADAERRRMLAAGAAEEAFLQAPNTPAFVRQLSMLLPGYEVEKIFTPHGRHWRLATTPAGDCVFLSRTGCSLDRAVRPAYCRLFPLWVYENRLTWFTAETCLAHRECASASAMLAAMNTDAADTRVLFSLMCAELGLRKTGETL